MNQFIDLQRKYMGCFLYDRGLRHERVKEVEDAEISVIIVNEPL